MTISINVSECSKLKILVMYIKKTLVRFWIVQKTIQSFYHFSWEVQHFFYSSFFIFKFRLYIYNTFSTTRSTNFVLFIHRNMCIIRTDKTMETRPHMGQVVDYSIGILLELRSCHHRSHMKGPLTNTMPSPYGPLLYWFFNKFMWK